MLDILIQKGVLTTDEAAQVQAEAAASAKAAVEVATSQTRVSGKLYVDFSHITAETPAGTTVTPTGTGIDVKRIYFGVTHQFNDIWSVNINTDSGYSSATGATNLFIKTAYVQAKLSPEFIVQAGSANMPWIPFDEDLYTFRYVEQTLVDRLHFGNSADWGLHVLGTQGKFSYNFAAVNGGGYKNPTRGSSVDFEGRVSYQPVKSLTLAAGYYGGKLGKDSASTPATRSAIRWDALAAYGTDRFQLGAEYFWESNWGYTASAQSDDSDGYSIFGKAPVGGPYSLFARYDRVNSSKKLHPNMEEQYFNGGVQWHAFSGIDISLVYKHDTVDNPASATQVTKYNEIGVFSQIAF